MIKIRQKHRTGCCVASLAMLLGISYEDALKALHPNRKPHQKVSGRMNTIAKALNRLGIEVKIHNNISNLMFNIGEHIDIKSLTKPALLCIYMVDVHTDNHAVVWDPKTRKVLDPGRTKNRSVEYYQKRLLLAFELL